MIARRIRNGQCFHQPYLGTREFPATLCLIEDGNFPAALLEDRNFGIMLYDIDYQKDNDGNITAFEPMYFRAEMKQGIIDLRNVEVLR